MAFASLHRTSSPTEEFPAGLSAEPLTVLRQPSGGEPVRARAPDRRPSNPRPRRAAGDPACQWALAAVACGAPAEPSVGTTQAEIPNPASTFCKGQGGGLEIRADSTGAQTGICMFADGSECDEWAFFRKECQPGKMPTQAAAPTSAPASTPAATPPEGRAAYTHPTLGCSFLYPARCTFESTDTHRYTLIVGPLEGDEHWPWIGITHPDETDYHPPADVDLQAWLADRSRLPGRVLGTRTIAGEVAIHTGCEDPRGPQSYNGDRYYFVHDGQMHEITILHTGKEAWRVHDQFLDRSYY
jgi:putative hemolysin